MAEASKRKRYELRPPDGGWGYAIMLATTVIMVATIVPLGGFGIIFGDFLAQLGDDTSGITLISSTYNTISFFMGIVANVLLKKYSFRKVALLGSAIHFIGSVSSIFVSSLGGLIFTYGVLEGIGFGLLLPASFSAFNAYFDKRMAFMMSLSQTLMVVGYIAVPFVGNWTKDAYGYRGTVLLLAGVSAFCFPASVALQPVKWHLKRAMVEDEELGVVTIQKLHEKDGFIMEPLVNNHKDKTTEQEQKFELHRRRRSSVVLGERVASVISIKSRLKEEDRNVSFWRSLARSMDLHLLADIKYMNMALGLSLSFTADVAFFPIVPSIMARLGFSSSDIALMISVFFSADLAARITLSIISALIPINSKLLVLVASGLSAVLRIALIFNGSLNYILVVLAAMGYVRCFIQTPQSLVISDEYPNNFEAAYSVYMVVNGMVCLVFGPLMSYVKTVTNSDEWVCHLLTGAFVFTVIGWTIEMLCCQSKTSSKSDGNDIS